MKRWSARTNGVGRVCETHDARTARPRRRCSPAPGVCRRAAADAGIGSARLRQLGLLANVEIKPAAGFDTLTGEVVARAVRTLWAGAELPLLSSFSEAALAAARAAVPELPLGMLHERPPADWLVRLRQLAAVTLHCDADSLNGDLLGEARANGVAVLCYTVNDPELASVLYRRGVAAVFSDRIDCVAGD
jgi:glycerophosphoryl diester phosphodiesterase